MKRRSGCSRGRSCRLCIHSAFRSRSSSYNKGELSRQQKHNDENYVRRDFGRGFRLRRRKKLHVSVFASESSRIMLINFKEILSPCKNSCPSHTIMISNFLRTVSKKSLFLNQKIDFLSNRNTREKILTFLSSHAKQA